MPLHIEISGDMTRQEWEAVATLAAVMLGTTALTTTVPAPTPPGEDCPDDIPAGRSVAADVPPPPPSTPADAAEAMIAAEENRVAAPKPPLSPPAGVDLDSDGLPWDARIHASTKTRVKSSDTWKKIRGVDAELVKQVEAELRQVMAAPVPPANTDPAAAFAAQQPANEPAPASDAVPPPPAGDVPPPPGVDVPAPPAEEPAPPATPPADLTAFAGMMKTVAAKQTAGTLSADVLNQCIASLGLTSIRDFAKRPDLIPALEAMLP